MKKLQTDQLRNLIFGAEDSLVSTVGVLFGVASASYNKSSILLTGLIVVVVEALSMGAGAYLSESSALEADDSQDLNPILDGIIMFFSYFLAGFIPLFPYMIMPVEQGKLASVGITLVALFVLGYLPQKRTRAGIRMAIVAGTAVLIGYLIATLFTVQQV